MDDQIASPRQRLAELFWILGPAYTRWADSCMDQPGLTPQRVRLLVLLKERGPVIMSSLRNELGVTATNITALVDALEKDGMVARKAHPTDRRATMIELTPQAETMLEENCGEFKEKVGALFTVFDETEQQALIDYLNRLKENFISRGILRETDLCSARCTDT